MKPEYENLRACIYSNENELKRFRQLVINGKADYISVIDLLLLKFCLSL